MKPLRLKSLVESTLAVRATQGLAPATLVHDSFLFELFLSFARRRRLRDAREVVRHDVEAYLDWLAAEGYSTSVREQGLYAVHGIFSDLVGRGLLLVDPVVGVARPNRRRGLLRRIPSRVQMQKLLDACRVERPVGVRDRALLEVLYGSALRLGELCSLTLDDVDLANRVATIRQGKGQKDRMVPLSGGACLWLSRYLRDVRSAWVSRRNNNAALFLSIRGTPYARRTVASLLDRLCERTNVCRVTPHALRAAAATHMMQGGADIRYVQELLGHAQVTTTQLYAQVRPYDVLATHRATHPREQSV